MAIKFCNKGFRYEELVDISKHLKEAGDFRTVQDFLDSIGSALDAMGADANFILSTWKVGNYKIKHLDAGIIIGEDYKMYACRVPCVAKFNVYGIKSWTVERGYTGMWWISIPIYNADGSYDLYECSCMNKMAMYRELGDGYIPDTIDNMLEKVREKVNKE